MTLFDDYKLLELLGQGSFGKVFKCQSKKDGQYYAVKEINYTQMKDKEKQLLVTEVNMLRKLEYPSIVRYIDRYQDKTKSIIYIVMELCQAGDLSKYVKQCKQSHKYMDEDTVWSVFIQILQAVDYCHNPPPGSQFQSKLINRDLKPANIFFTDMKTVKVGDFGLCRLLEENQIARTNVGTPLYMAPELLENRSYNEKVDIWSIGCILYEMCALQPPYVATTMDSLKIKVAGGVRPLIPPQYSAEIKNLINLMLQKDYFKRPGTKQLMQMQCVASRLTVVQQPQIIQPVNPFTGQNVESRIPSLPPVQTAVQQKIVLNDKDLKQRETTLRMREEMLAQAELQARNRCQQLGLNYDAL